MKAILTKYLPCTNTKGSRIKAWTEGGNQITIPYPHELSGQDVHELAAQSLVDKMEWKNIKLYGGGIENGYAFVMVNTQNKEI